MTGTDKNNEILFEAVSSQDFIAVKEAIKNGADVNYRPDIAPEFNNTTLMEAARGGDYLVAKLLVEHGADVNRSDEAGHTPLMSAIGNDSSLLAKYFIEQGADINAKNDERNTALAKAIIEDNIEITLLLLSVPGIDIDVTDYDGLSPLTHSRCNAIPYLFEEAEKGRFPSADEFDLKLSSSDKPSFADRVVQKEDISR